MNYRAAWSLTLLGIVFLGGARCWSADAVTPSGNFFTSPHGKFVVGFEPVAPVDAKTTPASDGHWKAYREQYWIKFYSGASTNTLISTMIYEDANPPMAAADVMKKMVWSPEESYVAIPVLGNAVLNHHVYQVVVSLSSNERTAIKFEADHLQWIGENRLIGDLNTQDVPGGIVELNETLRKAHITLYPLHGIGYHLLTTQGSVALIQEFTNDYPAPDKTSWESFTPACLSLNMETLKKRSVPCP